MSSNIFANEVTKKTDWKNQKKEDYGGRVKKAHDKLRGGIIFITLTTIIVKEIFFP